MSSDRYGLPTAMVCGRSTRYTVLALDYVRVLVRYIHTVIGSEDTYIYTYILIIPMWGSDAGGRGDEHLLHILEPKDQLDTS